MISLILYKYDVRSTTRVLSLDCPWNMYNLKPEPMISMSLVPLGRLSRSRDFFREKVIVT